MSVTRTLFGALMLCAVMATQAGDGLLEAMPEPAPAPAFDLQTPDGSVVKLADLRGKIVVVNFWATWCPPCLAEMPAMERAWQGLREKGVRFVGINVDEDAETVASFAKTQALSFPLLLDPGGKVTQAWPLRGLPTTFVVDAEGALRFRALGEREWDQQPIMQQILSLTQPFADLPATEPASGLSTEAGPEMGAEDVGGSGPAIDPEPSEPESSEPEASEPEPSEPESSDRESTDSAPISTAPADAETADAETVDAEPADAETADQHAMPAKRW